jgi:two-component system OmpR family response regulator
MKTVLVVDDSDIVLELVKKTLEGAGYFVITRNRPSGSVAAILRDKPDVVLLDVNMPTLSGDTIAKILERVSQQPETLILLHSNLSIDNLRLKAIATGAHGYIQKTDSPSELVRRIEYWLRRSRFATSSSRMEAAAVVSESKSGGGASVGSSSGQFETAPIASAAGSPAASGSGRWRAAAAAITAPPRAPGSSSSIRAARPAASSGAVQSALLITEPEPEAPATGGTPTSRNMRAAKAFGTDKPGKVLFVDDDWKMLSSYRTMVAGNLEAEFVSSGDDAFNRLLSDTPPQVVVCDVMMPGLSGADIYRRAVRLDPRWANRFVFITGAASTPAVAEFLNTLDVRVFHKPISTDRLLDTLKQMTEVQRR